MLDKVEKFINESGLLDKHLLNKLEMLLKIRPDVYIYITGVREHQGKSQLKELLLEAGFTHVFQRNEMYDDKIFNVIFGDDDEYIDKCAKELFKMIGIVIDFGSWSIPEFPM